MSAKFLAIPFIALACGPGGRADIELLSPGVFRLECRGPLSVCIQRAERVCKGAPYDVLRAQDNRKLSGSDTSQVETRTSVATIRCSGPSRPLLDPDDIDASRPPPLVLKRPPPDSLLVAPPSTANTPPEPRPTTEPKRACVPGTTQTCVGPAACNGGQSCLPDGSGYTACDCGAAAPPQ